MRQNVEDLELLKIRKLDWYIHDNQKILKVPCIFSEEQKPFPYILWRKGPGCRAYTIYNWKRL